MPSHADIVSGRQRGVFSALARGALHVLAAAYRLAIATRNFYYDYLGRITWVDRPCISVGNMTTGGTGKTPVVIWIARYLVECDLKVAILSRGYRGDESGNDELQLTSLSCPQALCIANPDRVLAAQYAIQEHDVDILVLDDGFQHRRIGRDLDIVLIDAACPLGYGYLLPRGLLREPPSRLGRADIIILTHLSLLRADELRALRTRCRELAPDATIVGCEHRPVGIINIPGQRYEISELADRSHVAFAGLGNPENFRHTLKQMGTKPAHLIRFPDHHKYTLDDCRRISDCALSFGVDLVVTTEKDIVKLRGLEFDWPVQVWALQIVIDFAGNGGNMLKDRIHGLMSDGAARNGPAPLPTG